MCIGRCWWRGDVISRRLWGRLRSTSIWWWTCDSLKCGWVCNAEGEPKSCDSHTHKICAKSNVQYLYCLTVNTIVIPTPAYTYGTCHPFTSTYSHILDFLSCCTFSHKFSHSESLCIFCCLLPSLIVFYLHQLSLVFASKFIYHTWPAAPYHTVLIIRPTIPSTNSTSTNMPTITPSKLRSKLSIIFTLYYLLCLIWFSLHFHLFPLIYFQ